MAEEADNEQVTVDVRVNAIEECLILPPRLVRDQRLGAAGLGTRRGFMCLREERRKRKSSTIGLTDYMFLFSPSFTCPVPFSVCSASFRGFVCRLLQACLFFSLRSPVRF